MKIKRAQDCAGQHFSTNCLCWKTGFSTKLNISTVKSLKTKIFCFENASWYFKHIVKLVHILIFLSQLQCTAVLSCSNVKITLEAVDWPENLVERKQRKRKYPGIQHPRCSDTIFNYRWKIILKPQRSRTRVFPFSCGLLFSPLSQKHCVVLFRKHGRRSYNQ